MPVRTMGLTHIAIAVKSTDRTLKFYQQVFGVEVMYHQNGFLQVRTPGCNDIIVFEEEKKFAGKKGGVRHFGFRLKKPGDISKAVKAIEQAGATITRQGEFEAGEPYVFFKDPDGYEVEVWFEKLPVHSST